MALLHIHHFQLVSRVKFYRDKRFNVRALKNVSISKQKSSNRGIYQRAVNSLPPEGDAVVLSCAIGIFTGIGVVAFNYTVHEIHDIVWHGIPSITWLRVQPLSTTWKQIMIVPVVGGVAVGVINSLQKLLQSTTVDRPTYWSSLQAVVSQFMKTAAAAVTLGTGNSLGPEGPSVEIGSSIGKGVGIAFKSSRERRTSFVAAGSAAGISSGFNAAVAGCFFAVETVLRSVPSNSVSSLSTAMVLLSSVLASVVSQAGLGTDPAFKVAAYDFRSPAELPLYLLLGVLCGVVSITLTRGSTFATTQFDNLQKWTGIPSGFLPPIGGLSVAFIALAYPEVLYWGFENVDSILESRPWAKGPPADLLIQLVGAKLVATIICRGSRLVGGVYAPSLFIGAALGSAYGNFAQYAISRADPIYHLDTLQVAAPQAYALVGMAATLAGVCQVPFASVLLLFELTRDYRIILPLMAAVGLSSWIASSYGSNRDTKSSEEEKFRERSLGNSEKFLKELKVSCAMRRKYLSVYPDTIIWEVLNRMVRDKERCVLVVGQDNQILEGILTLKDIQTEAESSISPQVTKMKSVWSVCRRDVVSVKPNTCLNIAQELMSKHQLKQLPVVTEDGQLVGMIDEESINLACRLEITRRLIDD